MCCNETASQGCALYSATGIIFMSFIGILLMKQPFLILGIHDVEHAKGSAFGAAGLFFFSFLVSIVMLIRQGKQQTELLQARQMQMSSFSQDSLHNSATSLGRVGPAVVAATVLGVGGATNAPEYALVPGMSDYEPQLVSRRGTFT